MHNAFYGRYIEVFFTVAALQLWRVVFTCKGKLGCFAIEFSANWSEHQSTLLFLILNALVGVTNISSITHSTIKDSHVYIAKHN